MKTPFISFKLRCAPLQSEFIQLNQTDGYTRIRLPNIRTYVCINRLVWIKFCAIFAATIVCRFGVNFFLHTSIQRTLRNHTMPKWNYRKWWLTKNYTIENPKTIKMISIIYWFASHVDARHAAFGAAEFDIIWVHATEWETFERTVRSTIINNIHTRPSQ